MPRKKPAPLPEPEIDMQDRYLHARHELSNLYEWLEALAFQASQPRWDRSPWYSETLGGAPKNREDLLKKIAAVVKEKAIAVSDLDRCCDNCKSLYFCELKIGHKGKHSCAGGGLKW